MHLKALFVSIYKMETPATKKEFVYFLIHPSGWINGERMAIHLIMYTDCLEEGNPNDISRALGNPLIVDSLRAV